MIRNGIDNLDSYATLLKGKRLGLITNPTGVNAELKATADILAQNFTLTALFGPEHGIRGAAQAGDQVRNDVDPILKLPTFSLFGSTPESHRIPTEAFDLIDAIVYDIQDVGVRFYTYIYTLAYALEDAAKHHVPLIVLDRINPLGGSVTEGILLDAQRQSSFVGLYPIPTRYGLTVGEFARYVNSTYLLGCELYVVPCDFHSRTMLFPQTGQVWVSPSPNLPSFHAALAYVGTCIFEGTNISEGRGTTHPFEFVGAPFINAQALTDAMNQYQLPGVRWRPVHFTPTFSKFSGELCHGVQLHVTSQERIRPFEAGLRLFQEIRRQCPQDMTPTTDHFDKLLGDDALATGRQSVDQLLERARQEAAAFKETTRKFLLY